MVLLFIFVDCPSLVLAPHAMSMAACCAIAETDNDEHGITPATIKRDIADMVAHAASQDGVVIDTGDDEVNNLVGHNLRAYIKDLRDAAANLEFERDWTPARRDTAVGK